MLNLSKEILEELEQHFKSEYPREACGVFAVLKGKLKWYPCRNLAQNNDDFIIDSKQYLDIKRRAEIVGIVHSHPDASCKPSEADINNCNALCIPYYIFSYPGLELHVQEPRHNSTSLIGREYIFGVQDCFEASRDWYSAQGVELPSRDAYEYQWWEKGLNYFTEDYINSWGFKKVDTPEKNDLLIFSIDSKVPNHCGVYLGNDVFFHHCENRLSCRENLYPFWIQYLEEIYRHET